MVALLRVKARWSGFAGAPGYSVMHFRDFTGEDGPTEGFDAADATAATARVQTFFNALRSLYPSAVTIQVEQEVDIIESTTGDLVDSLQADGLGPLPGETNANFSAPVGAVVNWRTGTIRNGRRLRGRTFLVPLSNTVFDTTGTLAESARSTISVAAAALAASTGTPDLHVYGRPSGPSLADGVVGLVTGSTVPDMAAVLRSRRD